MSDFPASKTSRGGLNTQCRSCLVAKQTAWKGRNRDRLRARSTELYRIKNGPILQAKARRRALDAPYKARADVMVTSVYGRCKDAGQPRPEWLTRAYVEEWLRRQPNCACCQQPFRIEVFHGRVSDASPSLDRLDPRRWYEPANTSLICWRCNNIKRNYDETDLRMVANWIERARLEFSFGNQADKFTSTASEAPDDDRSI